MEVLLAVGGSPNTFHPGIKQGTLDPKIFGNDISDTQIKVLANNIVCFLTKMILMVLYIALKKFTSADFIAKLSAAIKK